MFWEPHTSSIDFCESNYLHSNYIVELHNTWSSIIGLSSFGFLGLALNNHTGETRHIVAYVVLALIGLGSAGLHGTLHWFLQSADELPMMYLLMSLLHLCAEHDAPVSKPNYPKMPQILSVLAVVNTFIYYYLQRFYFVFICTFISEAAAVLVWIRRILYAKGDRRQVAKRICNTGIMSIVAAASPCWLWDMLRCREFIDYADKYFYGMTPHVAWHFGAGFGAYCVIVSLECCRLEELQIPYKVKFFGGVFPLVSTGYYDAEKGCLMPTFKGG